jgi:hypothetical protein
MGEIADMMLDGDLCERCGEYMEGGEGYARLCSGCRQDDRRRENPKRKAKKKSKQRHTPFNGV